MVSEEKRQKKMGREAGEWGEAHFMGFFNLSKKQAMMAPIGNYRCQIILLRY
jgi:hypothetical protein